jgi:hypothetical protein
MTSAPVTAPRISLHDRRVSLVASALYAAAHPDATDSPTGGDYARARRLVTAFEERGDAAITEMVLDPTFAAQLRDLFASTAERDRAIREAFKAATTPLPELAGFRNYGGIEVAYVGDDGDLVALGWHYNPAAVLHAFDSLAREQGGIDGVYDDPSRTPGPDNLGRTWCTNERPGADEGLLNWGHDITSETDGAFPITLLAM